MLSANEFELHYQPLCRLPDRRLLGFKALIRQLAKWPEHIQVSVNVSAVQIRAPEIVEVVASALNRHGTAPARLEFELTETAMAEDDRQISVTYASCGSSGCVSRWMISAQAIPRSCI